MRDRIALFSHHCANMTMYYFTSLPFRPPFFMIQNSRYRRGKGRAEASLEPAVPNPNAPEFKPRASESSSPQSDRDQLKPRITQLTPTSSAPVAPTDTYVPENPISKSAHCTSSSACSPYNGISNTSPGPSYHVSQQPERLDQVSTSATGSHSSASPPQVTFTAEPSPSRNSEQHSASPPPAAAFSPLPIPSQQGEVSSHGRQVYSMSELQKHSLQSFPSNVLRSSSQTAVCAEVLPIHLRASSHVDPNLQEKESHHPPGQQPLQEIQMSKPPMVSPQADTTPENDRQGTFQSVSNSEQPLVYASSSGSNAVSGTFADESEAVHFGTVTKLTYSPNGEILVSTNDRFRPPQQQISDPQTPKGSPCNSNSENTDPSGRQSANSARSSSRSSDLKQDSSRPPLRRIQPPPSQCGHGQESESSQISTGKFSSQSYGSKMAAVRASGTGVEAVSTRPDRAFPPANGSVENRQRASVPTGFRTAPPTARLSNTNTSSTSAGDHHHNEEGESSEMERLAEFISRMKVSSDENRARPLICQDITNSNADTLRISRLPRGVTYDRLYSMVEPFGEVEELIWTASDPYLCEVTYRDPAAAHEARHFLNNAIVGNDSDAAVKAELRSRDPGAQLFVGDLTPDVTEEMLESTFSELVNEPVSALLKRDPDSLSPIGYGFLSFQSESSANFALVAGHRLKIGNACVRVGRAERNTYLYVSDLSSNVSMEDMRGLFGRFGALVDEDTVIIRRSYAFIRYKNRGAAEKAKRTLDKTELKGKISVRYAEAEPLKACVAVQFHSSVPRPPNSLRDLLSATFSKYGNCAVEIPRLHNGLWRKVAFVTFHGEPISAHLAALEAVQSVRFVSSLPVCCQFAREMIPRLPSRGLTAERMSGGETDKIGGGHIGSSGNTVGIDRSTQKGFVGRRNAVFRPDDGANLENEGVGNNNIDNRRVHFEGCNDVVGGHGVSNDSGNGNPGVGSGNHGNGEFVPVYVPISALQHPSGNNGMTATPGPVGPSGVGGTEMGPADYSGFHPWLNRMMVPNSATAPHGMMPIMPGMNPGFNAFASQMHDRLRW